MYNARKFYLGIAYTPLSVMYPHDYFAPDNIDVHLPIIIFQLTSNLDKSCSPHSPSHPFTKEREEKEKCKVVSFFSYPRPRFTRATLTSLIGQSEVIYQKGHSVWNIRIC